MSDRLDDLLRDPATRRCYDEVVTGEKPLTLDGVLSCYGEDGFEEVGGVERMPQKFPVIVPTALVDSINGTYAEVSRHEVLTEADFEQRLYEWLSEATG